MQTKAKSSFYISPLLILSFYIPFLSIHSLPVVVVVRYPIFKWWVISIHVETLGKFFGFLLIYSLPWWLSKNNKQQATTKIYISSNQYMILQLAEKTHTSRKSLLFFSSFFSYFTRQTNKLHFMVIFFLNTIMRRGLHFTHYPPFLIFFSNLILHKLYFPLKRVYCLYTVFLFFKITVVSMNGWMGLCFLTFLYFSSWSVPCFFFSRSWNTGFMLSWMLSDALLHKSKSGV